MKKDDFVIALKKLEDIEEKSIGQIKMIYDEKVTVFFIGKRKNITTSKDHVVFLDVKKTGKSHKNKICNICHILKTDFDDFETNQTDAKGRKTTRPSCKVCRTNINGDKFLSSERKKLELIKPKYIFTCPICNKISIVGVTANLVKDHNHKTGKARKWLCDSCNTGLGRFKDDIQLLQKAIDYLKNHS